MRTVEVRFPNGAVPIDAYGDAGFRIGGEVFRGSVAVFPDRITPWNGLHDLSIFTGPAADIDVLIVGMGREVVQPESGFLSQRAALEALGVGVDLMTTPSACRTYNVLLSEGRRIAAALVPV